MKITLVKAQKSDLAFLTDLRKQTMYEPLKNAGYILSDKEHELRVRANYDQARIIMQDDKKVGLIKYMEEKAEIRISQFQILPAFQKQGIGRFVLNDIMSKARDIRKPVKLKVLKNSPAVAFYKSAEFKITGEDEFEYIMLNHG